MRSRKMGTRRPQIIEHPRKALGAPQSGLAAPSESPKASGDEDASSAGRPKAAELARWQLQRQRHRFTMEAEKIDEELTELAKSLAVIRTALIVLPTLLERQGPHAEKAIPPLEAPTANLAP